MTASRPSYSLGELAQAVGAVLVGDPSCPISGIAPLADAKPGQLSFLSNPRYTSQLGTTQASAVLLAKQADWPHCPCHQLLVEDAYLAFAQLSHYFETRAKPSVGCHASSIIDPSAEIHPTAMIGPRVVVGARAHIAADVEIGAGCIIGADCQIGVASILRANVSLYDDIHIGCACIIHSGVVVGSDGFGFAPTAQGWQKVAQLGGVRIGDQVEIGANTAIDRGALGHTIICDGVKLDNLNQIAHNVVIGPHTVMAAGCAIAGSTKLGARCRLGGAVVVAGHLKIVDDVTLTATTAVNRSIKRAGTYSSGAGGAQDNREWRKNNVRFRQLDKLARKVLQLQRRWVTSNSKGE